MDPTERFRRWMQISVLLYGLGGASFALLPRWSFELGDRLYRWVPGLSDWPPMPETQVFAWTVLAVSMMATITVCAALAARDPVGGLAFALPILVSKGVSSLGGLVLLAVHARYPIYLGLFLTDFPLFVLTLFFWRGAATAAAAPAATGSFQP